MRRRDSRVSRYRKRVLLDGHFVLFLFVQRVSLFFKRERDIVFHFPGLLIYFYCEDDVDERFFISDTKNKL